MSRQEWIELAELAERHAPYLVGMLDQITDLDALMILDQLRAKNWEVEA